MEKVKPKVGKRTRAGVVMTQREMNGQSVLPPRQLEGGTVLFKAGFESFAGLFHPALFEGLHDAPTQLVPEQGPSRDGIVEA